MSPGGAALTGCARHEALRCTFVAGEDDPHVQILSGDTGLPVVEDDLRGEPDAEVLLSALCHEEARTPFDLARGPLIRGRLRLDALPLTVNGKLDRKALPAPEDDAYARRAYEAPRGEVETLLAAIWEELLGVERIGRHDNFFELGGHSLLAVRLLARLTEALAVELPLAILFAKPTLADLARESSINFITHEFDRDELQKLLSSRSLT
ncbi:hypothetical protein AJ87_00570 [Rhizobium yanglingense]|nr:hypothetical protein AJ87_00570 [Rhizobium yanglingense]